MEKAGLSTNKNMIPYDSRKPLDPSGIRIGTPAITTRGMKEAAMKKVARLIKEAILHKDDEEKLASLHEEVKVFCSQYPVPGLV